MIDSRKQQLWGSLHARSGALAGRSFPIEPNGFYIGRDATQSQIVVDSPSVSKRHVWVGVKDGAVVAVDQKTTNGTYLNSLDTPITEIRLKAGDTLILSDDVARFTFSG
jgi:pSer/pThr/pTyr-binding forkhead associated (FHA) protein